MLLIAVAVAVAVAIAPVVLTEEENSANSGGCSKGKEEFPK